MNRWWMSLICYLFGHGQITDLDGRPVRLYIDTSGRCSRCGYIGMVNDETGRFFGLFR